MAECANPGNNMTRPSLKQLRRWWYRHLPARASVFYPARRRGLDGWAAVGGETAVAEIQKRFLLHWVGKKTGSFVEWDAGDGVVGSHAIWLEEAGWRGVVREKRNMAAELLQRNRPLALGNLSPGDCVPDPMAELISARREETIRDLMGQLARGARPRWVILQARDPHPEVFRAMARGGYHLDHFIHDDEYYQLQRD